MARALRRVGRQDLTISRERRGKGHCFRDEHGVPIREAKIRGRIKAMGIPPAWRDVRIAQDERAHIQAVGIDEAGRVQYIYHSDWEATRSSKKQARLSVLTSALPRLRRKVRADLEAEAGSRILVLAIAVAMIDRTAMRVGREKYLDTSGTRGAGTLYSRDVRVNGAKVCMSFDAKGGKRADYCVTEPALARAIERVKTLPGKRLLLYRDEAGKVRPLQTSAINDYLRERSGVEIAAKDFRTLHASALAGEELAKMDVGETLSARRRQMAQVTRQVADALRNTPMICRKSYITPCLFELFDQGKLGTMWAGAGRKPAGLLQREARLGAVLAAI